MTCTDDIVGNHRLRRGAASLASRSRSAVVSPPAPWAASSSSGERQPRFFWIVLGL
jgi:hypothetical protein